MRKEASLPIRLDTEINGRLEATSEKLGIPKSTLIRMLIKSFVEHVEANGGKITLPVQWEGDPAPASGTTTNPRTAVQTHRQPRIKRAARV